MKRKLITTILLTTLLLNSLTFVEGAEQTIKLSTTFPNVELKVAQKTVFKIKVQNNGIASDTFNITVSSPINWETTLKSGSLIVKSIYLEASEIRELDLELTPPSGEKAGIYLFTVKAFSKGRQLQDSLDITIELPQAVVQSGISISSLFPSIEAASGEAVEFRLNVINKNTYDALISFTAVGPQGWSVTFTPAYETVSVRSLEFAPSENQVIVAKITSPKSAVPGTYTIDVEARSENLQDKATLSIFLIGKYDLKLSPSNQLLSFDLPQGEPHAFSFYVNNTGTAPLNDVAIFSDLPTDWDIQFDSSSLPQLAASSFKEVRAVITSPSDTIPGDYVVTLYSSVTELGISGTMNYRVTVKGSVEWGFFGIGVIVILVLVLVLIYWRLGRR
jgi:uncharacterized membrane protein